MQLSLMSFGMCAHAHASQSRQAHALAHSFHLRRRPLVKATDAPSWPTDVARLASCATIVNYWHLCATTDPQSGVVQDVNPKDRNVRSKRRCSCVLQFTRRRAFCCVLHRPTSLVIHRSGLCRICILSKKTCLSQIEVLHCVSLVSVTTPRRFSHPTAAPRAFTTRDLQKVFARA
jgi:hypothetical protein